jgi:uncharacterized protein (DUF362 family)/Pyruvate/2-oxoacid:ferredoxin oxidoreductase delta subunit
MSSAVVSIVSCREYEPDAVRTALRECLAPLGGMEHFVRPGMKVLLKPNLLTAADWEQGVTTHPAIVRAVAELVQAAGGEVWIGDSPALPIKENPRVWRKSGMDEVAEATGARLLLFESVVWKQLNGNDYFIAKPVTEADLVIDLPKLKTHASTLYTGAVKNLFGTVPGKRKTEMHLRAPGMPDFSRRLADILELVHPGLVIMDGVLGMEGNGPGTSGTPHAYNLLAASADAVALDTVLSRAMGFRAGEVLHLVEAGKRNLGVDDLRSITVVGDRALLDFGRLVLPTASVFSRIPSWLSAPVSNQVKLRPEIDVSKCIGCGKCSTACPASVITAGNPPTFNLSFCIGCMCCVEVCPEGALAPHRSLIAKLVGIGG